MKMYKGNFGFNNFNKAKMLLIFSIYVFFFVAFMSVGFAAFQATIMFKDISARVNLDELVRISGFRAVTETNAVSSNIDYNYNNVYGDILLPEDTSTVTYEVTIVNLGKEKTGVASIVSQNSNLDFDLLNYSIGEALSENGEYTLGITQTILFQVRYADVHTLSNEKQPFKFDFTFKPFYTVTYHGIPGEGFERPTEIMAGTDLVIITQLQSTDRLRITMDTVPLLLNENYTYDFDTDTLTVMDVAGDLLLSYRDIAYLINLSSDTAFYKESAYKTKIENVSFVNYVPSDLEDETIEAYYDLTDTTQSDAEEDSIIAWITANENGKYDLFIGSIYDIYTKNFESAFSNMTGIKTINFENLDTSESVSFAYTFYNTQVTHLNLETFNTTSAWSMLDMFAGMTKLETLDVSNFNTSKVTNMWYMFGGLTSITELDISTFDTSKVQNMAYMFSGMSNLNNLILGENFSMASATNTTCMFADLYSLETIDLSMLKASPNLTTTSSMFVNCTAVKKLDVSKLDTSSVTHMDAMFKGMTNLQELILGDFQTTSAISMSNMFMDCRALTTLDVTSFRTSTVADMSYMFGNMYALTALDLQYFELDNLTNISSMFYYCTSIQSIDFRSATFNPAKFTSSSTVFTATPNTITVTVNTTSDETWVRGKLGQNKGTIIVLNPDPTEEGGEGTGDTGDTGDTGTT